MFSLFTLKKTLIKHGLPQQMTDVHMHLLPGVDDGAKTAEESIALLEKLYSYGVKRVILTPHVAMSFPQNDTAMLKETFEKFKKEVSSKAVPELHLAAEYMLDEGFLKHLNSPDGLLTFDGERVLVEVSFRGCSMTVVQELLFQLSLKKYIPVLAHPERYPYMKMEDYKMLRDCGCESQLNIAALGGRYGKASLEIAQRLLSQYMYEYAASDMHGERHMGVYEDVKIDKKTYHRLSLLLENNSTLWGKE